MDVKEAVKTAIEHVIDLFELHPKTIADFEITDEKNNLAREAVGWFRENLAELYQRCEERDSKARNSTTK